MTTVPLGKAARATRAVSAGIVPIGSGRRLMADPSISREVEDHAPGCITVQFADSISATCRPTRADHVDVSRSRGRVRHDAVAAGASNRSGANPMQVVTI